VFILLSKLHSLHLRKACFDLAGQCRETDGYAGDGAWGLWCGKL